MAVLSNPLAILLVTAVVVGLLMVIAFGYTSDQKAIGVAKGQLQAHLLAVRLYRDQIPVVMGSYGKILRGTGRYLKLAFKPLIYVIVPITLLMVQMDRYLGQSPIPVERAFLLTVHLVGRTGGISGVKELKLGDESGNTSDSLDMVTLELPQGIEMTAPPVHVTADNDVVWRLLASDEGSHSITVLVGGERVEKGVWVGNGLARLSPIRLRGNLFARVFSSAEPEIPASSQIRSIAIDYPERDIQVAGYGMNWIWLFFIVSMIAGFAFKEMLGIQI